MPKSKSKSEAGQPDAKERKPRANYPKYTLDEALQIATAIHTEYVGKPMPPDLLAKACGATYGNTDWRIRLAASQAYGLTDGSYNAGAVALTPRAEAILSPRSSDEKDQALADAVRAPQLFNDIYKQFPDGKFPTDEFFANMLIRDYQIPRDDCDRFVRILKANSRYVHGEPDAGQPPREEEPRPREAEEGGATPVAPPTAAEPIAARSRTTPVDDRGACEEIRVFVGHSKNEQILDILRSTLDLADFKYEIAEDEETVSVPVPEKVLASMRRCNAGIVNVSADEQQERDDHTYEINQNVLIEIGAAFVLYPDKVILLWDERLPVPSNLQGLYRCSYQGDDLTGKELLKLQKAIANFRP